MNYAQINMCYIFSFVFIFTLYCVLRVRNKGDGDGELTQFSLQPNAEMVPNVVHAS